MKKIIYIFLFLLSGTMQAQEDYMLYKADTLQSKIFWKCDKHDGIIKLKTGGWIVDQDKNIVAGRFYIDMHSIKDLDMDPKQFGTAVLIFENTLKNEFFEADKFPLAVFDLQEIKKTDDKHYELTGDFTLHGITNCITFKAEIKFEKGALILKSEKFTIDRTDWGVYRMSPKRPYQDDENGWTVPDEIELHLEIKTLKD